MEWLPYVALGTLAAWFFYLALAALVGFAVGRWWVVWAIPLVGWIAIVVAAVVDNFDDPCTRPDGCGIGPVLGIAVLGVPMAAILAAAIAGGVLARSALRRRRAGAPLSG